MIPAVKAVGLALFALGIAGRRAVAQIEDYADLVLAIEGAGTTAAEITLAASIEVAATIPIEDEQDITIKGAGNSISVISGVVTDGTDSIFNNQNGATLTLDNIVFEGSDSARAVHNKGALTVTDCSFANLNGEITLERGAAIYSESVQNVMVSGSTFKANLASAKGGAICAVGTETLDITDCTFKGNEVGVTDDVVGSGGDVYAVNGVTLSVDSSNFTDSTANNGGGSIECCGATITNSRFAGAEAVEDGQENHGGAVLVGRPDSDEVCEGTLTLENSYFYGCTVGEGSGGGGGSLAIFDTSAVITDCTFEGSSGTALLFESSDADGGHTIIMKSTLFNENSVPAEEYAAGSESQGTAFVIQNTGAEDGEAVTMGELENIYCFGNDPYECEFVYDMAWATHEGEFKCRICDIDGESQESGADDDLDETEGRSVDSGSSDSNDAIVIALSLALGLMLVVIGALAVWKFRVRKNARRLMEDMGDGDL